VRSAGEKSPSPLEGEDEFKGTGEVKSASSPSPPRPQGVAGEGRGEGVDRQEFALRLRKAPTDAERIVWQEIRCRQIGGCKFRRQYPVDGYIPDFICFDPKIIIEIDGGQHNESAKDKARDAYFVGQGFRVLRFWNNDVLGNIDGVLQYIELEIAALTQNPSTPSPQPSPATRYARGGEGADCFVLEKGCTSKCLQD
jgi:very-short-patch-repair endonuclease